MRVRGASKEPLTREMAVEGGGIGVRRCKAVEEGEIDLIRPSPSAREVEG